MIKLEKTNFWNEKDNLGISDRFWYTYSNNQPTYAHKISDLSVCIRCTFRPNFDFPDRLSRKVSDEFS